MGSSLEEAGLDLTGTDVAGVPGPDVWARGVCACGHRMAKHRFGHCEGVPTGRRSRHDKVEDNRCLCREARPVVMVTDGRLFQLSWKAAYPAHPFNVALRRLDPAAVERWLVETPIACENPECGGGGSGGVRMVYQPGTRRMVSGFACPACAPESAL